MAAPLDLFGSRGIPPEISEHIFHLAGPKALASVRCTSRVNADAYEYVPLSMAKRGLWCCRVRSEDLLQFALDNRLPFLHLFYYQGRSLDIARFEFIKELHMTTRYRDNELAINAFPPQLEVFECDGYDFESMPALPNTLRRLVWKDVDQKGDDWEYDDLDTLCFTHRLPSSLTHLTCELFTCLELPDQLPAALVHLSVNDCYLPTGTLPALPATLTYLSCINSCLTQLPDILPPSLLHLDCSSNEHMSPFPALPAQLKHFSCSSTGPIALPTLPLTLEYLNCAWKGLTGLVPLPDSFAHLSGEETLRALMCPLPAKLKYLHCNNNNLTSLPEPLPQLLTLSCYGNQLVMLPPLPATLLNLHCQDNWLPTLPTTLPPNLERLDCSRNDLLVLPALVPQICTDVDGGAQREGVDSLPAPPPPRLIVLRCDSNKLTALPTLPATLLALECENNRLDSLPTLPDSLAILRCTRNPALRALPALPSGLEYLNCDDAVRPSHSVAKALY